MKSADLKHELQNLKYTHLTEDTLAAYYDQELDQVCRIRVEGHLEACFICERRLALLEEESAALSNQGINTKDVTFIEQMTAKIRLAKKPSVVKPAEVIKEIPLRERLAEYLRQLAASWQIQFAQAAVRGIIDQGEEVWRGQSNDSRLHARAIMEKNADLTLYFSSNDLDLEGVRFTVRLGSLRQEITLQRISDAEVCGKVEISRRMRPRNLSDISIELV
jgi:hypothetical protein